MALNCLSQPGMPFPRNPRLTGKKAPDKAGREKGKAPSRAGAGTGCFGEEVTRDDILYPAFPGFQGLCHGALGHPSTGKGWSSQGSPAPAAGNVGPAPRGDGPQGVLATSGDTEVTLPHLSPGTVSVQADPVPSALPLPSAPVPLAGPNPF